MNPQEPTNPHQSQTDRAFSSAVRDTMPLGKPNGEAQEQADNIVASGIVAQNDKRPMIHLYRFKAWFTPPGSPLPAEGTMVSDRCVAANWDDAVEKIRARLTASCLMNKLNPDAYQIGKLEVIELDLPVKELKLPE